LFLVGFFEAVASLAAAIVIFDATVVAFTAPCITLTNTI